MVYGRTSGVGRRRWRGRRGEGRVGVGRSIEVSGPTSLPPSVRRTPFRRDSSPLSWTCPEPHSRTVSPLLVGPPVPRPDLTGPPSLLPPSSLPTQDVSEDPGRFTLLLHQSQHKSVLESTTHLSPPHPTVHSDLLGPLRYRQCVPFLLPVCPTVYARDTTSASSGYTTDYPSSQTLSQRFSLRVTRRGSWG